MTLSGPGHRSEAFFCFEGFAVSPVPCCTFVVLRCLSMFGRPFYIPGIALMRLPVQPKPKVSIPFGVAKAWPNSNGSVFSLVQSGALCKVPESKAGVAVGAHGLVDVRMQLEGLLLEGAFNFTVRCRVGNTEDLIQALGGCMDD